MAWPPGTRIGGYDIVGELGAGGMGEVYRARDARLQRDVALKILPSLFLADPDRLARFEREARVLASLNHQHIAAIYDIVEAGEDRDRAPVLVLELVEGETLQERLARGPLELGDALAIARQIAEALEAAHEKGIVHRDLKPANVKIAPEGVVKVLDFGLAKALDPGHSGMSTDPALSPTETSPATAMGTIMGTVAYMAPEQARAQPVDRRADIWAFGAVLYEMLSGTRAFPGETVSDILAAVLKTDPDWTRLPRATPAAVRTLLARCLERDPRQRLQAIGEARILLAAPHDRVVDTPVPRSPWRAAAAGGFAAVLVLAAIAAAVLWRGPSSGSPGAIRKLDVVLEGLDISLNTAPTLSPDGQRIVYRAGGQLWVRALNEFIPKPLPGSTDARYPAWSPDSRQLAFVRDQRVWRVGIDDAAARPVGAAPGDLAGSGGSVWTLSDELVLAGSDRVGLFAVRLSDGSGREILPLDRSQESDFHDVTELPDGRGFLLTVHRGAGPDTIAMLVDGKRHTVMQIPGESLRSPVYAAGYLLYAREALHPGVWAVPFSLSRLAVEGDPILLVAGGARPTVGADGTLAFVRSSDRPSQVVAIDRGGSLATIDDLPARAVPPPSMFSIVAATPDRQRIAVALRGADGDDLFSYDHARRITTRMTVGAAIALNPVWSHDGSRVYFVSFGGSTAGNVYTVPSNDASRPERVLPPSQVWRWPCAISPDGRLLIYAEGIDAADLWVAALDGTKPPQRLTNTPSFREEDAEFSPDGLWLAYTSNPSGRPEIYLRAFTGDVAARQISREGGTSPAWSPDGREIFYRTDNAMMSVKLANTASGLDLSAPQQLFSIDDPQLLTSYAISPDGQRFIFVRSAGNDRVSVILDWPAQLQDAARAR